MALEGELTQAAAQRRKNCTGTAAQAIAEMPAAIAQRPDRGPGLIDVPGEQAQRHDCAHAGQSRSTSSGTSRSYDTLCVAVAIVSPGESRPHSPPSQSQGMSVAALAKKYSVDASAAKGGRLRLLRRQFLVLVRHACATTLARLRWVTSRPRRCPSATTQGDLRRLFVAATSKTPASFARPRAW